MMSSDEAAKRRERLKALRSKPRPEPTGEADEGGSGGGERREMLKKLLAKRAQGGGGGGFGEGGGGDRRELIKKLLARRAKGGGGGGKGGGGGGRLAKLLAERRERESGEPEDESIPYRQRLRQRVERLEKDLADARGELDALDRVESKPKSGE